MLLTELVRVNAEVADTRSRSAKTALVAGALRAAGVDHAQVAAGYLAGSPRQRRTGIGWRGLADLPAPATEPTLRVAEVDAILSEVEALSGPGSATRRAGVVAALFGRATAGEQRYLRALLTGQVRQGAMDGVLQAAIAVAAGVDEAVVRRAVMLAGRADEVARIALHSGEDGLRAVGLQVGRPVRPMLAGSAPDVATAVDQVGSGVPVAVERKIDGIRLQAHKDGAAVRLFTRSLDEITDRLPEVVAAVAALPATRLVLDAETLAVRPDGSPEPFQVTGARMASRAAGPVRTYCFDLLHVDGRDLLDESAAARFAMLQRLFLPPSPTAVASSGIELVARTVTADPVVAQQFFDDQVVAGHEGVIVKDLQARYAAGRRGAGWVKVKPRHTLDLVVIAVEWGSGRRRGLLSNIHLAARSLDGGFVMLGKTFKGMADEMLAWQTRRFLDLETGRDGHIVTLRPEQVVEVAVDGVQRSSRYPGGVALRFARVLRYRQDKTADQADTLETVLAMGA